MLRQKYVAGTHCYPIYAVINLYTVHIVIQVLGKFLTKWLNVYHLMNSRNKHLIK